MNAYSYVRWSSAKQTDGDSFLRQTEKARSVCLERGWHLVDLGPDAGVSAYKGKNLSHKGILGQFIKRVEQGLIPTPCVLIVERLDRFSRREVDEVLPLFLKLLKDGVEVYSALDNDHYTHEKVKDDPITSLLKLVMAFVGANQYSRAIGERVRASRQRRKAEALAGKQVFIKTIPSYFTFDKAKQKYVTNEKATTVKHIFNLYLQQSSFLSVARALNLEKVPTFHGAKSWSPETIRKVLTSRYVIGEYQGVKDYLPRIIKEDVFNQVQTIIASQIVGKGKRAQLYNFLHSIGKCTCGMNLVQSTNRVGKRYFGCRGAYRGTDCTQNRMIPADIVEQGLFAFILQSNPDDLLSQTDTLLAKEVKRLRNELSAIEKQVDKLLSVQDLGMDILRTKLKLLQQQQSTLTKDLELKQSKLNAPRLLDTSRSELAKLIQVEDWQAVDDSLSTMVDKLKDDSFRRKLREPLTMIVRKVVVNLAEATLSAELTTGLKTKSFYIGD